MMNDYAILAVAGNARSPAQARINSQEKLCDGYARTQETNTAAQPCAGACGHIRKTNLGRGQMQLSSIENMLFLIAYILRVGAESRLAS